MRKVGIYHQNTPNLDIAGATVARRQTVTTGRVRRHAAAPQTGGDDRHAARPRPRRRRLLEPSPRLDVQGKRWDGTTVY